ncbi:pantoate--beta-alanine ligase [Thiohalospira halophila DSM 15071]|uniref:Pantothenate synthetase n=1 Tax=Thiohalospira halophila DSM 15071 TaxID=1123397 RepID=A0A1I1R1P7_9GAMM|nr:pantoate--beta-alanine ligase [Thiohalospira halophila]SFD24180.1 pantoate--beta-alanine ligase [Thiohalospira halophila DSM 15071]
MHTDREIRGIRTAVAGWRGRGEYIGLVPTMGNLHDGHLRLVEAARRTADRVVVSLFVNPLQFAPGEDYERYPRSFEADAARLAEAGVDLLFAPDVATLYPDGGSRPPTRVEVPGLSDILCGAGRPGHFTGVATVVTKLFNIVAPDAAWFGEKDYQQLLVIRRLVADLCLPVEVFGVPTVRESDGLALSSRNGYLTPEQRAAAPALYQALTAARDAVLAGEEPGNADTAGWNRLQEAGFEPEYFTIRRAADLDEPGPEDRDLVALAAARLGEARLIDNVRFER